MTEPSEAYKPKRYAPEKGRTDEGRPCSCGAVTLRGSDGWLRGAVAHRHPPRPCGPLLWQCRCGYSNIGAVCGHCATPQSTDSPWITSRDQPCPSGHTDCTVDCGSCKGTGMRVLGRHKSTEPCGAWLGGVHMGYLCARRQGHDGSHRPTPENTEKPDASDEIQP